MKKFLSLLLAALLLFSLAACGDNDGSLEDYLEKNPLPDIVDLIPDYGSQDSTTSPSVADTTGGEGDNLDSYIPEGGDAIPEKLVGSWSYVEIYQWAQASDITVDEAISREKDCGVHFAYGSFTRYGEVVENPVYKTNAEATYNDMSTFGIDPSALKDMYGSDASVTSVTVYTPEGAACTTVFLINDSLLLAFGEGMNVFMYEAVEAVG